MAHRRMLEISPIISAVVTIECSSFLLFLAFKPAESLEITSGSPLETTVSSTPKTLIETWYKPNASAPNSLERKILKKKPSALVSTEKTVINATALNKDFIKIFY